MPRSGHSSERKLGYREWRKVPETQGLLVSSESNRETVGKVAWSCFMISFWSTSLAKTACELDF